MLGCFLFLAGAAADPAGEIRELNLRRFAAMVRADTAELGALLAREVTYTHANGVVETREQFLAAVASKKLAYRSLEPSGVEVRIYGDAAVATGRLEMKVALEGRELAFPARFTAVYVREDGAWRLAAWQTTRLES